jgi:hypothetical protein
MKVIDALLIKFGKMFRPKNAPKIINGDKRPIFQKNKNPAICDYILSHL